MLKRMLAVAAAVGTPPPDHRDVVARFWRTLR